MSDDRPIAAQFCATFLKPEMLHIYRQIAGMKRYRPVVYCQKRENADAFPFGEIRQFPKPGTAWLRRIWLKQMLGRPLTIEEGRRRAISDELVRSSAKILHVYFGHIGVFLLPLLEKSPVPVVVSFHGADAMVDLHKPRFRKATQRLLQVADGVLVRSDAMGAQLALLGCDPAKIHRHRTGIPLDQFVFTQRAIPAEGAWHVVQACRLIEKKGLPVSLRAFAEFAKVYPNARFTIAGEGPLLPALQILSAELGIASNVRFSGFLQQEQLRALYRDAHFFLHPSETGPDGNQEGVPNSMLEAMASGLPVLATRHGGIPEAVEHGSSGILVEEGDSGALARGLLDLASNPGRYAQMAKAGSEAVREGFENTRQVAVLEGIYDRIRAARQAL